MVDTKAEDSDTGETGDDDVEDSTSNELEDILQDARTFLTLCNDADGIAKNRQNGLDDLKFLTGGANQWDSADAAQRTMDGRPMLTINKLPTFLHQVTNSLRQNRPSIKVHPVGGGADKKTAEVRQGMIKHIEYDSNADVAYDTAVCSAAAIGFGYFRIITDYTKPDSFDQEIKFSRIRNSFTVRFDPMSTEPDGSDQRKCLILSRMTRTDFKRQWPDAEANDTALSLGTDDLAANWLFTDEVVIAEFYRVEEVAATAVLLTDGSSGWEDDLGEEGKKMIAARRPSFKRKVMLYKITGTDKLEETEIKCNWIPVFPVYGDEVDCDGNVVRSGLIRNAKDPAIMYNYWMTSATEEVALRPKTPYIGAEGQFSGYENDWKQANRRSFPFLQYRQVTLEGQQAPPPQRQPMADIPNGMLTMAMHANDNIKATTGLFDSSLGARGNATSGKQEMAQQRQGDIANFHFADSLNCTLRHAGRCVNWMIPHYYDTKRVVRIMRDDDTISQETINQPQTQITEQGAIQIVLNDMTGGEFDVTVESGPSYSTMRQESAEIYTDLAHNNPQLMGVAGDIIIGAMDLPDGDKLSARLKKTIPPELTAGENPEDANSVEAKLQKIAQAQQAMQQQGQMMDQKAQLMQKYEQDITAAETQLKVDKAALDQEKAQIESQKQILKAEFARISAEMKLKEMESQAGVTNGLIPWEETPDGKKAYLDAQTKLAVAEISADTTKTTAAMSANSSGDGTTTVKPDGTTEPSNGLTALIEAVNTNMTGLLEGQQLLAQHLTKPKVRTAKKQPDGSFLMMEQ